MNKEFEVRNKRKQDWFWTDDEFVDDFFKILDGNTIKIYFTLCRLADKNQKCYPSIRKIRELTGLSASTICDRLKVLEFFKLIKRQRTGKTCNNRYYLLDKSQWKKNFKEIFKQLQEIKEIKENKSDLKDFKISDLKDFKITTLNLLIHYLKILNSNSKENIIERKTQKKGMSSVKTDDEPFSFNKKLKEMEKDKRRHIHIISIYWKYKGIMLENKEQYQALLKRDLRPARLLTGFTDDRIIEVMEWLEEENDIKWTLETVFKYITEDLDNIKPIKGRFISNY